jgi:A/G-specific adenine glycosylase
VSPRRATPRASSSASASSSSSAAATAGALPDEHGLLVEQLVGWFASAARELPWRNERTAYRVWLSEVMLQQTRVAVVVDYFTRFTARFPDVNALAAASEDDVLGLWSGLGYYSRGRNLHKAARFVVDACEGRFPSTRAGLRALPGIGDYTSAAIASLAFGESVAVVDGNVHRVLMRLCADDTPIDTPRGLAATQARAQALVAASTSSAKVNEGLMELGALVCTPRSPLCGTCPWRASCRARATGDVEAFPVKAKKAARKALRVACVVVVDDEGRLWLERRASHGLFGGLWEPPCVAVDATGDDGANLEAAWRGLLQARGLAVDTPRSAPLVVTRTLTHRDLRFDVVVARAGSAAVHIDGDGVGRWLSRSELATVGTSTAVRAVLDAALGDARAPRLL